MFGWQFVHKWFLVSAKGALIDSSMQEKSCQERKKLELFRAYRENVKTIVNSL